MTTTTVKAQRRSFDIKTFLAANGALVGLVVLCLALFIATPDFLTGRNLLRLEGLLRDSFASSTSSLCGW